jgi:uncharacterized protein DUF4926
VGNTKNGDTKNGAGTKAWPWYGPPMIRELDTVILTRDVPQEKLHKGDVGAIVLVHRGGAPCEVEFVTLGGETLAVVTLPADAVRATSGREIVHVREAA